MVRGSSARGNAPLPSRMPGRVTLGRLWPLAVVPCLACGPTVAPPTPAFAPSDGRLLLSAEQGPSAAPSTQGSAEFRPLWTVVAASWNRAVVLAPWGDVVSFGSRELRYHAARSGEVIGRQPACVSSTRAVGFVDAHNGALVCEQDIRIFSLPDLRFWATRPLPGRAQEAAFGGPRVAVAFDHGPVRLFDTADWAQAGELEVGGRVTALALSSDGGQLAVGYQDGRLAVRRLPQGAERMLSSRRGHHPVLAVAFSPDGAELFAAAGPRAEVWSLGDGSLGRRFRVVTGVNAARWLSAREIATVGAEGLLLLDRATGAARTVAEGPLFGSRPPASLDASRDGRVLCTGEPKGMVRCYARGRAAEGAASGAAATVGAGGAPPSRAVIARGRVVARSGKQLTVELPAGSELPPVGAVARLLQHMQAEPGSAVASGWLHVADVRVDEVDGEVLGLTVATEKVPLDAAESRSELLARQSSVKLSWSQR